MENSMNLLKILVAAAALALSSPGALAAPAKELPLRDFFKNPEQAAHQISPNGRYISWLAPYQRPLNLFVGPYDGRAAIRVTPQAPRATPRSFWKGDRILFAQDFGGDENVHILSADLKG